MIVDVSIREKPGTVGQAEVAGQARKMLSILGVPETTELSIVLADDPELHQLNRTYRGIDRATDVLSFAMLEDTGPTIDSQVLGDVVLSMDAVARQAKEHDWSFREELDYLLLHGLLHLLGHDHATDTDAARMDREMRRVWSRIRGPLEGGPTGHWRR